MVEVKHILIAEDERVISNLIATILSSNGYNVILANSGKKTISLTATKNPDLILLDLGLPDIDGIKVLKSIREWSEIPIIIVSARKDEHEKVSALDAGADDYITKPFGSNELLARIRTAFRLYTKINCTQHASEKIFSAGNFKIDYNRRTVSVNGIYVHLTPIEYKIIVLLSQNAGRVLTHDYIIKMVWGPFSGDSQVLRVNMANIRRKIEENPGNPKLILTEVGVGYRMVEPGLELNCQ